MCLHCGRKYNIDKILKTAKSKHIEIPCNKCRFKQEYEKSNENKGE